VPSAASSIPSRDSRHDRLVCVECGTFSADGRGWRGLLAVGDEDAEDVEEVVPSCAEREFDGP
jgi:hypothetical protein